LHVILSLWEVSILIMRRKTEPVKYFNTCLSFFLHSSLCVQSFLSSEWGVKTADLTLDRFSAFVSVNLSAWRTSTWAFDDITEVWRSWRLLWFPFLALSVRAANSNAGVRWNWLRSAKRSMVWLVLPGCCCGSSKKEALYFGPRPGPSLYFLRTDLESLWTSFSLSVWGVVVLAKSLAATWGVWWYITGFARCSACSRCRLWDSRRSWRSAASLLHSSSGSNASAFLSRWKDFRGSGKGWDFERAGNSDCSTLLARNFEVNAWNCTNNI